MIFISLHLSSNQGVHLKSKCILSLTLPLTFFFRFTFFHLFHKVFQGCGTYFFKVVQNPCAPLYLANKGKHQKGRHALEILYSSQPHGPKQNFILLITVLNFLWLVDLRFKNRFCENLKLNSPLFW